MYMYTHININILLLLIIIIKLKTGNDTRGLSSGEEALITIGLDLYMYGVG